MPSPAVESVPSAYTARPRRDVDSSLSRLGPLSESAQRSARGDGVTTAPTPPRQPQIYSIPAQETKKRYASTARVSPRPILNPYTLELWRDERGITQDEHTERCEVERIILKKGRLVSNEDGRPERLQIPCSLDLYSFEHLTSLPDGLDVSGSLNLSRNGNLRCFGAGLNVGNDLDCTDCFLLCNLKDFYAGGNMYFVGCYTLAKLPPVIFRWKVNPHHEDRELDLTGTKITLSEKEKALLAERQGIKVIWET